MPTSVRQPPLAEAAGHVRRVLPRRSADSADFLRPFIALRPHRVLRRPKLKSDEKPKQYRPLHPKRVLHQLPRDVAQNSRWRPHGCRRRPLLGRFDLPAQTPLGPVRSVVLSVVLMRPTPLLGATRRVPARPLAVPRSRSRLKPSPTDRARLLPSHPLSVTRLRLLPHHRWVISAEHRWVISRER